MIRMTDIVPLYWHEPLNWLGSIKDEWLKVVADDTHPDGKPRTKIQPQLGVLRESK